MSTIQASVTEVEQCPLHRLLMAERQSLDAAISRLAGGMASQYEPLTLRSRVAGMVQYSICRRRASGGRPRASELSRIEEAAGHLSDGEQTAILEALTSCQVGCELRR
ncbi:MAG: hypothetical protein ACM3N4_02230 [Nitrososphaerota archaeon]